MPRKCPKCGYKPRFFSKPLEMLLLCPNCSADLNSYRPRHRTLYIVGTIAGITGIILIHLLVRQVSWPEDCMNFRGASVVVPLEILFGFLFVGISLYTRKPLNRVSTKHANYLRQTLNKQFLTAPLGRANPNQTIGAVIGILFLILLVIISRLNNPLLVSFDNSFRSFVMTAIGSRPFILLILSLYIWLSIRRLRSAPHIPDLNPGTTPPEPPHA